MFSFNIHSVDSNGNKYLDEVISTFDIRDFLKIGDYFQGNGNDVFKIKRKITFFEPSFKLK